MGCNYLAALASVAWLLASPLALAAEISSLMPLVEQARKQAQEVTCGDGGYYDQSPPQKMKPTYDPGACETCKSSMDAARGALAGYEPTVGKTALTNVAGSGAAAGIANGTAKAQNRVDASATELNKAGSAALAKKAADATAVASQGAACSDAVKCDGNLAQNDKEASEAVKKACEQITKQANTIAGNKSSGSMGMDGLGELTKSLGQALQSMQGKPSGGESSPSGSGYDPSSSISGMPNTNPDIAIPEDPALQDTKNGLAGLAANKSGTNGTANSTGKGIAGSGIAGNVGNGLVDSSSLDPSQSAVPSSTTAAAANPYGASGSSGYGPKGLEASSAWGTNGSSSRNDTSASGGGSSGSASLPGSATGASRMQGAGGAGDASKSGGDPYEINQGGGGRAILGLKGRSSDLADLEGLGGAGAGDFKAEEEGARELASESVQEAEAVERDSLFGMIRSRYAELKKRGNL